MASVGDGAVTAPHSCLTFLLCSQEKLPIRGLTSDFNSMDKNANSATFRILKVPFVSKGNCLMHHSINIKKAYTSKCTHFLAFPDLSHTQFLLIIDIFFFTMFYIRNRQESLFSATFMCVLEGRGNALCFLWLKLIKV